MVNLQLKNYSAEAQLFTRRVFFAIFLVVALLCALIGRLVYLQINQHELYTTLSNENQMNLIPVDPNRGLIYDRNGVLLAENVPVYSLDVIPAQVPHFEAALKEVEKIINITPEDLLQFRRALKQRRSSEGVSLKLNLTEDEVARFYLDQYRFPGFGITGRLMRYYPQGDTMVSAIGYVARINEQELASVDSTNYAASNYVGKLGIEKFYEPQLHGKVGYQQVETDANGQVVRTLKNIAPIPGDNLYLSIDSGLQKAAEAALGDDQGAIVAIKPSTGEVLAFVSNPRYDPNLFVKGITPQDYKNLQQDPERPLYNRALRGLYPSGSIMKPFLATQYLDLNIVNLAFTIHDPGWFSIPGVSHVFKDWKKGGHGIVNMYKAIVQSCDTYFYTVAAKAGINRMNDIQYRFGLGKPTGLDVDEELGGVVPSPAWKRATMGQGWYEGDTVNAGIGQGFTLVTPLQMAEAMASLANRGIRYKPHFALKWQKPDGTIVPAAPEPAPQVKLQNPWVWDFVLNAMKGVVDAGTARSVHTEAYTVGGKTGTAEVFRPKSYGDKDSPSIPKKYRAHAWFIGFAPVEKPQIAIAVLVENHPHYAPVVAKKVLDYYLLPDHGQAIAQPQVQAAGQGLPSATPLTGDKNKTPAAPPEPDISTIPND